MDRKEAFKKILDGWSETLKKKGQIAFWPSFLYGQYIKKDNLKAQDNVQRLATREYPDVKKKVVRRHGRNILINYVRKTGAEIIGKNSTTANANAHAAKIKLMAKQHLYFEEDNHLAAVTAMLNMPRNLRRTLAGKLNLKWTEYLEAEAMIREG